MEGRTPPINKYTDNSVPGNPQIAMLQYKPGPNSHFILAPSIESIRVDEFERELLVAGVFGEDPRQSGTGIVTMNGNPLTIKTWSHDVITCTIPASGPSAAGNVMVTVRGHESNVVQLTEWIGDVRMNMTSGYVGMHLTVVFRIHLRADVHSFRKKPHEVPLPASEILTFGVLDSHGDWSLGGTTVTPYSFSGCDVVATETWANNSGSLPIVNANFVDGIMLIFDLRPRARTMKLTLNATATNAVSWTCVDSLSCLNEPPISLTYSGNASFVTSILDTTAPGFDAVTLSFAQNFDILPFSVQRPNKMNPIYGGNPYVTQQPTGLTTIECSGIQARFPPDPNGAQKPITSARRKR